MLVGSYIPIHNFQVWAPFYLLNLRTTGFKPIPRAGSQVIYDVGG
jgi:hypothetical protein